MANSTPVQSIDRVFDIVEALSSSPHGMSLTDLAAAVGLHVSTVHRLLASLGASAHDVYTLQNVTNSDRKCGQDWRNGPAIV